MCFINPLHPISEMNEKLQIIFVKHQFIVYYYMRLFLKYLLTNKHFGYLVYYTVSLSEIFLLFVCESCI